MRQRIANTVSISVDGVDLTAISNIEFYVRQNGLFFEYVPTVVNASTMIVIIPKEDADLLMPAFVRLQFAYTNADGRPDASDVLAISVAELLKTEGYDAG